MDSVGFYHMCPNRSGLVPIKSIDHVIVWIGNKHACMTVGLGTIRIKMHDGVRTLIEGISPTSRRNLFHLVP